MTSLLEQLESANAKLDSLVGEGAAPAATFTPNEVVLTANVATLIRVANASRRSITITNCDPVQILYLGPANTVTATGGAHPGLRVYPLQRAVLPMQGAIYGIAAANITVGYAEL